MVIALNTARAFVYSKTRTQGFPYKFGSLKSYATQKVKRLDPLGLTLQTLSKHGFLLLTDACLPSLAELIAGEKVHGSWWGHSAGKQIFYAAQELESHTDVLTLKLISGKVTFVWRSLWNEVISVAAGAEEWQSEGLSDPARDLKRVVDQEKSLRLDSIQDWPYRGKALRKEAAAVEVEKRLLVYVTSEHTESGKHVRVLQTWQTWAGRAAFSLSDLMDPFEARRRLDSRLAELNSTCHAHAAFPWSGGIHS